MTFGQEMTIIVEKEGREGKGGRPGKLPDNAAYTNRFIIKSETSNSLYTIAQSKSGRWWSCSCLGWIRTKHCKHLRCNQLPGNYVPKNVIVKGE